MNEYDDVAAEAERPKRLANHRDAWERLPSLSGVNGVVRERVEAFCAEKQISLEALIALGTRVRVDERGGVELAWGYEHNGAVTAVKVRPLGDKRRYALAPSVFLQPLVIGRRDSLDWIVAEGETDAARLFDLVGDTAAIIVLPAGAKAFKQQWADLIPRGATVGLALDADEAGDVGAEKAARVIGGRTIRVRPPVEGGDWCDWEGSREEFLELVRAARANIPRQFEPVTATALMAEPEPEDASLLGPLVQRGGRTIVGGTSGHGKTTVALAMAAAILTGEEFLGYKGAGVGPVLFLDLEQGLRSIKRALREAGLDERDDVYVVRVPDGLSLDSDPSEVAELERIVVELEPVLVVLDPYYKAHRGDANEERAVVDLMRTLDALRARHGFALLLPAHVRKEQLSNGVRKLTLDDLAGSGALTRGAEVVVGIERLAHGFARLRFLKDRDGDLLVGDALNLTYSKEKGFQVREEEDFEAKARSLGADGEWRIMREWRQLIGCGEKRMGEILDALVDSGLAEFQEGPEGRRKQSKCWRILPRNSLQPSEAVEAVSASPPTNRGNGLTALPSIREGKAGGCFSSGSGEEKQPPAVEAVSEPSRFCAECERQDWCAENVFCWILR